jgi:hypothetical protein
LDFLFDECLLLATAIIRHQLGRDHITHQYCRQHGPVRAVCGRAAACCGLLGSLLTRYGWMAAGRAPARDWRLPLEIPKRKQIPANFEARTSLPRMKAAS